MSMQNTLGDLNNHLFAQLEKLNDDDLNGEEFTKAGLAVAKVKIAVQKKKGKNAQNDYINKGSD